MSRFQWLLSLLAVCVCVFQNVFVCYKVCFGLQSVSVCYSRSDCKCSCSSDHACVLQSLCASEFKIVCFMGRLCAVRCVFVFKMCICVPQSEFLSWKCIFVCFRVIFVLFCALHGMFVFWVFVSQSVYLCVQNVCLWDFPWSKVKIVFYICDYGWFSHLSVLELKIKIKFSLNHSRGLSKYTPCVFKDHRRG